MASIGDELKIIGQLTKDELRTVQDAQEVVARKMNELELLRRGQQYSVNQIVASHKFPTLIRVDYETGIVYNVPTIGDEDVRSNA